MADFKFKCPQCGQLIETDTSYRGQTAECPYCGKGIVVPKSQLNSPRTTVTKTMTISCPHCGTKYEMTRNQLGFRSECSVCHKKFILGKVLSIKSGHNDFATCGEKTISQEQERQCPSVMKLEFRDILLIVGGILVLFVFIFILLKLFCADIKNHSETSIADTCPIHEDILDFELKRIQIGHAYKFPFSMNVISVLKEGVLIRNKYNFVSDLNSEPVFLKTTKTYVDGDDIEMNGLYICTGRFSYNSAFGASKTVWAFEEMDPKIREERLNKIKEDRIAEDLRRQAIEEQKAHERALRRIKESEEREKAELELKRQREENERKLEAQRIAAQREIEKARIAAERQAEEERKKRYPIEQAQRRDYAAMKLRAISFDVNSYFIIQKSLRKYVAHFDVTEKMWKDLARLQSETNWLEMLNVAGMTSFEDFPDTKKIDSIVNDLTSKEFHVELVRTHESDIISVRRSTGYLWEPCEESSYDSSSVLHWKFRIADGKDRIIYAGRLGYEDKIDAFRKESEKQKEDVEKDFSLGKIDDAERECRIETINARFCGKIMNWLDVSNAKVGERIKRDKHAPLSQSARSDFEDATVRTTRENHQLPSAITASVCRACRGRRFVTESVSCEKCDGSGVIVSKSKIMGFNGRPLSHKCQKCNGSGRIMQRLRCSECNGSGKVLGE